LHLISDLGQWWERCYHLPIPLGGIALRRTLDINEQRAFARILRRSVEYAMQHPNDSRLFVKKYAQELNDEVINSHIKMFVNDYTLSVGAKGRQAIRKLVKTAMQRY
jgi:1,4-dihydroxy-6-naphthoate synthase